MAETSTPPQQNELLLEGAPVAPVAQQQEPVASAIENDHEAAQGQFLEAASAQRGDPGAEWELDSSDSSDSSTDGSSSSDDEEEISAMDPAAMAKALMEEDEDDEDEFGQGGRIKHERAPKTINEIEEAVPPLPQFEITPTMGITSVGHIQTILGQHILIKGHDSTQHEALELGSVLCTAERKIVGMVNDTFGKVRSPFYSTLIEPSHIAGLGLQTAQELFSVDAHSKRVFTDELRKQKYTDASNMNDEEVNLSDLEFSDDEEEAAYKKQSKLAKKAGRRDYNREDFNNGERFAAPERPSDFRGRGRGAGFARGRGRGRGIGPSMPEQAVLDYGDDDDGSYRRLQRPDQSFDNVNTPYQRQPNARGSRGYRGGTGARERDQQLPRGGYGGGWQHDQQADRRPGGYSAGNAATQYSPVDQRPVSSPSGQHYFAPATAQFNPAQYYINNAAHQIPYNYALQAGAQQAAPIQDYHPVAAAYPQQYPAQQYPSAQSYAAQQQQVLAQIYAPQQQYAPVQQAYPVSQASIQPPPPTAAPTNEDAARLAAAIQNPDVQRNIQQFLDQNQQNFHR